MFTLSGDTLIASVLLAIFCTLTIVAAMLAARNHPKIRRNP